MTKTYSIPLPCPCLQLASLSWALSRDLSMWVQAQSQAMTQVDPLPNYWD